MNTVRDIVRNRWVVISTASGLAIIACAAGWAVLTNKPEEVEIARYATSTRGRTRSQVENVRRCAASLDGTVIAPGEVFSFLDVVGPWTADRGYVKAPVSYDGELVRSWGGGVCQASTTLYNAALLANLEIVERHHHFWPARYAPLGRDAAVAHEQIDLKIRNTLDRPVRVRCDMRADMLVCRLLSDVQSKPSVRIETRVLSVTQPATVLQDASGSGIERLRFINRGQPGFTVTTYRVTDDSREGTCEVISEDTYPVMNRVVRAL